MPYKRRKLKRRQSKRLFSKTAKGTHRKNVVGGHLMRGGIRL